MPVKLLYLHHDVKVTTPDLPHIHPFWQIEACIKGVINSDSAIGKISINEGEFIIFPPAAIHAFPLKRPEDFESISLKFSLSENEKRTLPVHVKNNFFTEKIISAIYDIIKEKLPNNLINMEERKLIEYLIWDLVDYCCISQPDNVPEIPELARKLKEEISYQNKNISVAYAAERLGYTPGHLNYLCKKELGVSAKNFIDNEILRIASEHLKYSTFNVSEISKLMRFPDVYTFSKFFKKMSGHTPSDFRKNAAGEVRVKKPF